MARMDLDTASYFGAQACLHGRDSVRIGHNTTLETLYSGDGYAVRYHATHILTMRADGTVEINTGGWDTVTTKQRLNALLPAPFSLHSNRVRGETSLWLYARGWPVTPFVDGLTVNPADDSVSYQGETILTAADITAIIAAAETRRATLDARREERRAADHAARPNGLSDTFRHRWDCEDCRALRETETEARRAILHAEHDRGAHVGTRPIYEFNRNADGSTDYGPGSWHATGATETFSTCPWECPDRTR